MTKRAALILAGGKARRFQVKQEEWQDKALAELEEKRGILYDAEVVDACLRLFRQNKFDFC